MFQFFKINFLSFFVLLKIMFYFEFFLIFNQLWKFKIWSLEFFQIS